MEKSNKISEIKKSSDTLAFTVKQIEAEHGNYFPGKPVLLGLSGGVDSTVLFQIFCQSALKRHLRVIHFNYGLRANESDDDAEFCASLCTDQGVAFEGIKVQDIPPASGIQKWARDIRQEYFTSWIKDGGVVALAHHADDLAETAIFRLVRGASPGHLLGMERRKDGVWRPLLNHSKATIAGWAKQKSWDHRYDGSNDKIEYSRNFIRHEIMPRLDQLFPNAGERINALAREAHDLEQFCLDKLRETLGNNPESLSAKSLVDQGPGVAFQAVRLMFKARQPLGDAASFPRELWRRIFAKLETSVGEEISWCFDLPGGLLFKFNCGDVSIVADRQTQKSQRAMQHRQGLALSTQEALLPPGASLKVKFDVPAECTENIVNEDSLITLLRASYQNKSDSQL